MLSAKHAFYLMWLFIVFVSAHDGYLVLANRASMSLAEQNPFGRWLIQLWNGDIWLLLMFKAVGTVCAASLLLLLHSVHSRFAWTACAAIAAIQLVLLVYLYAA